ncbi:MAG: cation:proton antiporter [Christiangramia sp.]|uniref:Glutathione-regulated potassium-efflux system protein KefC n=1 Tax=Christiangramia flava JLT2011 TaxID=1229726 RepID=A0A1L7HZL3_9FLAO|nr:cation:proton antiporter [Christiangramia flava]APU66781.1 Glutathione-regulated potassium-efflux system protein KefC [Christiangramia flava JLT2011]MAM19217.1 potassium transporter KefB [Christiangramia sp.]OSS38418.1 Glutathione-regulated potassium-efflux system protein KefC [Christiangramia flava JLT2011]
MEIPMLQDIVVILGLSILIILAFQRLKLPAILGFLLAGIIAGPYAFNLISSNHEVELLSEIGIIFLLFVIGIELSLKGLASIKKIIFLGGGIQVGGTILITAALSILIGLPWQSAVFLGFLFSLSSTAIVLKLLQEKGEITAPHGRIGLGILIFQDIIVVPMMLFTPLLAGETPNILSTVAIMAIKILLVLVVVYILARYIVPKLLGWVVKTRNQELFILTVVVLCFGVAWLTSTVGLSLALGAFFAGLIISESDYSHQATANVLPFREIFISFFFISVGTLLNLDFFFSNILNIALLVVGVVLMKMIILAVTVLILKYPPRTMLLVLFSLFQVGEFSLLLSGVGKDSGIIPENIYQYFLAISIISMGLTPFLIANAEKFTYAILKLPISSAVRKRLENIKKSSKAEEEFSEDNLHDHLVVIGYGINGQNISKAAKKAEIPYVILDTNPETFKKAKAGKEPIVFGDATNALILKHAHIQEARVIVIAISDPNATKKILTSIRQFTQTATVIVRTRYVSEIEEVIRLGADEVIPEEFETSIEIFTRVLKKYLVPFDEIQDFTNQIRSSDYEMLTSLKKKPHSPALEHLNIPNREIVTIKVQQNNKKIVGKSIEKSGIGKNYGVTVLAIQRDRRHLTEISPQTEILQGDLLYLFGHPNNINNLNRLLSF